MGLKVTRFGDISSNCQNFKTAWQYLTVNFLVDKILILIGQNSLRIWANLNGFKWPNNERIIKPSGPTVGPQLVVYET